jgi:hypothetical protein
MSLKVLIQCQCLRRHKRLTGKWLRIQSGQRDSSPGCWVELTEDRTDKVERQRIKLVCRYTITGTNKLAKTNSTTAETSRKRPQIVELFLTLLYEFRLIKSIPSHL